MVKVIKRTKDTQHEIESVLDETFQASNLILYKMIETKEFVILYLKEDQ